MSSMYEVKDAETNREASGQGYREPGGGGRAQKSSRERQPEGRGQSDRPRVKVGIVARVLRDMRIGKKLTLGFGVLMALLVCVAVAGYFSTQKLSNEMVDMLKTDAAAEELYSSALLSMQDMRKDERDNFLAHGDQKATQAAREEWTAMDQHVREALQGVAKLAANSDEKDEITSMQRALDDYEKNYQEMAQKLDAGQLKTVKDWQDADKPAKDAREFIEERLRTQTAEHRSRMDDREKSTEKLAKQVGLLIFGVVLAGLFAGGGISVATTKSIAQPVALAVEATEKILRGDRNVEVDDGRKDELGHLMASVKQMSEEFANRMEAMAKISSMVENAPVNVMYADLDMNLQYMNTTSRETLKKIEHLLPVKVDEMLGRSIDVFHKNPEHQRKMLTTDRHLPHEALIDLGPEKMLLRVNAVYNDQKQYIGPMLTWELVTEKLKKDETIKQAEIRNKESAENIGAVNRVLEAVMRATSTGDAARMALETVKEAFGWAYGSYWMVDPKENALRFSVESGAVNEEFRRVTMEASFREGEGLSGRAWKSRDLYFVEDLGELKDCVRAPVAKRAGVKSGIAFPVMMDGKIVGTMDFFALEALHPSQDRLDALKNVGRLVSGAFGRIAATEKEQKDQQLLREKVENILSVVQAAAKGDLTQDVSVKGEDAIGQMGEGLQGFFTNLRSNVAAIARNAQGLASASEELSSVSQQMSANAEETSSQANVVAAQRPSRSTRTCRRWPPAPKR